MSLKQKNIALLIGLLLLFWLSYRFSFSKAVNTKNKYHQLKLDEALFKNIPDKIFKLNQENVYLDSLLTKHQISSESSFQNNLLQNISFFAKENDLQIISFNEPHLFSKDGGTLNTYSFSIKGNYTSINKLIYNLEQKNKFGRILSVKFEKKRNFRTNRRFLICEILLRRIEK